MTTERENTVRLVLYGCSHRPNRSAMSAPAAGADTFCFICKKMRTVMGIVTAWANALVECQGCTYVARSNGRGKKALLAAAIRHSNNRNHKVHVIHDGIVDVIKPQHSIQLPLIDDLLLP